MSSGIKARDIHAVWLLLKEVSSASQEDLRSQARKALNVDQCEEIARLVSIATSLQLIGSMSPAVNLTPQGQSFASAKHWRLWTVPSVLQERFIESGIHSLFLGSDSWEQRACIVDLFGGAGGLSLAFESAGFAVRAAIDNDAHACNAFEQNFPNSRVIRRDIQFIANDSADTVRAEFGLGPGELVGVIGSPPCQGFSNIGERMWNDPRNELGHSFFDVVLKLQPLFFVFENVPALQSFGARPTFATFLMRQNKVTGMPASAIVDSLPAPEGSKRNRSMQTKKRLISGGIEEARNMMKAPDKVTDVPGFLCETASAIARVLSKAILSNLPRVYDDNSLSTAQSTFGMQETRLAAIAISLAAETLIQNKRIDRKDCISYVKEVAQQQGQCPLLSVAAKEIVHEYESLPKLEEYREVAVGPALGKLVEQASVKYDVNRPIILDAADYGAPQKRKRLFLIGARKDCSQIWGRNAQFWDGWLEALKRNLASADTAGDALGDMPNVSNYNELTDSDILDALQLSEQPSRLAAELRLYVLDNSDMSLPRTSWNPYYVDGCKRTMHHESVISRLEKIGEGGQDKTSRRTRLHRSRPSQTLRAGTLQDKGSHTAVRPIHFEHNRVITVREGARLMGYPDWMTFHGSNWHGSRLVGNGVPVKLGHAIAASLRDSLHLISNSE